MRRSLSIVLAVVLALALIACPVMAANGDGSGGGNGEKQVEVSAVTIGDKDLKDAEVDPSGTISVVFTNGMDENKGDNIKAITITGAEVKVAAGEDKKTFVVTYADLKAGDHELVVAKTAKANNGTMLKEDYKVAFKVKEAEKPHEDTCPSKAYTDVEKTGWTHAPIDYVLEKGYMVGTDKNKFGPNNSVVRAMVVQVLYAKEGKPAVEKKAGFKDVPEKKWYTDAVNWAAANGIVAGFEDKTFKPEDAVTREQLALMFKKYAELKKLEVKDVGGLSKFKDQNKVSKWAVDGMKWAVGAGIISGDDQANLNPTSKTRRVELAVMLKAFDEKVDNAKEPAEGEEPEESPKPSESEKPAESETSAESEAPATSENPAESAAPAESPALSESAPPAA